MIRKFNFNVLTMILALLFASTAVPATELNPGLGRIDNAGLPQMWERLDRPQNSFKQPGGEKSSFPGFPQIGAVWTGPTQWMTSVNWGAEAFGGGLSVGEDFFGSNLASTDFVKVQIIFESDMSKQTLCQTFRRDPVPNYAASGVGTFPGSAWDISDTLNPRRLNICFVEYSPGGNVNLQWDPTTSSNSREYLFVMNSDYDSTGDTYNSVNISSEAYTLDILYGWWPVLTAGHTFFESEPCTLTITPYYIGNFIGVPDETEIILDWKYLGGLTLNGFYLYCDTLSPPTTLLTILSSATTRYTHSALTTGETYYYRVEAIDSVLEVVASSQELSVTAQAVSSNVNLIDFWNGRSRYGDCWGYTDTLGNEYGLICARSEGVSIIDLSTSPISEVGFLPALAIGNDAKDIKIYKNYAILINEFERTQIFDISDVTSPVQVSTILHDNSSGAHNCKVEGDYLYIMGDHVTGGLLIYNISDPAFPSLVSTFEPYYYHDIDIYNDTLYAAAIFGQGIDVLDITNKAAPSLITTFNYAGSGAHNVAVLDSGRFVAIGDEIGTGQHTRIFDVQNLGSVTKVADIIVDPSASAHNCYEKNDTLYIASYTEGLQIYEVSNPASPVKIGHYDTYLESGFGYRGNWSVYPYLPSGKILLSDMQSGLFVVEFVPGPCCVGSRGDINGDGDDLTILDLTFIVDFIFRGSADPGSCPEEADLNADGEGPNILDLTFAVDRIFRGGAPAEPCP